MRISTILFVSLLFTVPSLAQYPGQPNAGGNAGRQMNAGHFYGRIVDVKSGRGIEFATIQLFAAAKDSSKKSHTPKLVTGALTASNGDFSLENIPVFGNFTLVATAIGYDSLAMNVSFNLNPGQAGNAQQMMSMIDKDLGNISLSPKTITLSEVVVSGEEPLYKFELDKKVYNPDKDPSNAGGTAEDVLKKVPSVMVDIDGNVTLRNAAPQIFVDGRPTTLSLDQIPSDAIDKIEVITNPSAKYDASGGQSGIINIEMKKNRRIGYNGNLRFGVDMRGKVNGGGDINVREGKINVFANAFLNQRKSVSCSSSERYATDGFPLTNIFQTDTPINNRLFASGSAGLDYFVNNRNTITVRGSYMQGMFESIDDLYVITDTVYGSEVKSSYAVRNTENNRMFQNAGASILYKHLFPKADHNLTADLNFNRSEFKNDANNLTQYYDQTETPVGSLGNQLQEGNGTTEYFTGQSDYANKIKEDMKIEAGIRGAIRHYTSENHVYLIDDVTGAATEVPDINNYTFDDQVYAAYATFTNKINKFQYNAGLRVESSFYSGVLTNENQSFKNNFPLSLFPSGFVSYSLSDDQTLQLNYSRRIDRPSFFQLSPYTDYSDSLNLQQGNPDLLPQFTNTFELNFQQNISKATNVEASAYMKYTNDLITRYQVLKFDSAQSQDVIINTYQNANSSYLFGLELTGSTTIKKWLSINANINLFQSYIDGSNIESNLTNRQFSWFGKLNTNIKLPANFTLQLGAEYTSKTSVPQSGGGHGGFWGTPPATLQGYVKPSLDVDFSVKKEFLKTKAAAFTLSISDIFATDRNDSYYETDYFTQSSSRIRDPQFVRLNFSYRFGKFDASLFKRKNTGGEMVPDMSGGG